MMSATVDKFSRLFGKNWNCRQVFQDIWQKIGASIPCFVTFLPLPIKAIPFHSQRCRKTAGPTVRFAPLDPTFPFPPFLPLLLDDIFIYYGVLVANSAQKFRPEFRLAWAEFRPESGILGGIPPCWAEFKFRPENEIPPRLLTKNASFIGFFSDFRSWAWTSLRARRHRVLQNLDRESGIILWRHRLLYDTSSRSFTDGTS